MLSGAPRILVVDDDRESVEVLTAFLRWHGYRVLGAANTSQAFRLTMSMSFDLLVIDLDLMGHYAAEILGRLQANKVIGVTDANHAAVAEQGIDHLMSKPVDPAALLREARRLLS